MAKSKWPENLSVEERIKLAQAKTRMIVTHVLEILALHENNSIIVYSNKLAGQIPESTAANAFNTFQQSMHRYEIVRICALWDSVEPPKENIPTVIALIQSDEVIERLACEMESYWSGLGATILNPSDDPELAEIERDAFAASEKAFGKEQGAKVREELIAAISLFKETADDTQVIALRNLRDKKTRPFTVVHPSRRERPNSTGEVRLRDKLARYLNENN